MPVYMPSVVNSAISGVFITFTWPLPGRYASSNLTQSSAAILDYIKIGISAL